MNSEKTTGLMVYYFHICDRKLWFSNHDIAMENENEDVKIGKFLDDETYRRERKQILINNEINLDFFKSKGEIHEVKKSRKIEDASIWQVKYYLYYLEKEGIFNITAKIDYPLLKKNVSIELSETDRKALDEKIEKIKEINASQFPPQYKLKGYCKKCAFYDLCLI